MIGNVDDVIDKLLYLVFWCFVDLVWLKLFDGEF